VPAGEERASFFKDGTYAQACGLPGNKCLVLWEPMFDAIIRLSQGSRSGFVSVLSDIWLI
jgi:hypothetical protein